MKMQQRFIELGNGYTDLFELIELAKANRHRLHGMLALHTIVADQAVTSPVLILKPTDPGNFRRYTFALKGFRIRGCSQTNGTACLPKPQLL